MTPDPHIVVLQRRHAALDNELAVELTRPAPDTERVRHLKQQKLRLKDAMLLKARAPRSN